MPLNLYPNGIGGTAGDSLVTQKPILMEGDIWYVSSASGNASNTGKDRLHPLTTLSAAVTSATHGDIIVLLSDHDETVSTAVSFTERLTIVGEGSSAGVPGATLRLGHATANVVTLASGANSVQFINIRFRPYTSAAAGSYVQDSAGVDGVHFRNCYFEFDQYNDGPGIEIHANSSYWRFQDCTFISVETAATPTTKPDSAIRLAGVTATDHIWMTGCTFDGGVSGFEDSSGNPWAFDGSASIITTFYCENLSLLRGADMKLADGTGGFVAVTTSSGNARVISGHA